MPGQLSSGERELATLADQLAALEDEIRAARRTSQDVQSGHLRDRPRPRDRGGELRGERVTLADGAQIAIRPIEPDDVEELAAGFERLGALTRFRLFGGHDRRLTHRELAELADVDHRSSEMLIAFEAVTGEGIGIARYDQVPGDLSTAEVTCVVVDQWQHRGVGSALAQRLSSCARAAGIDRCTAELVLGNDPARHLLAHVADQVGERHDGGTVDVTAKARRPAP